MDEINACTYNMLIITISSTVLFAILSSPYVYKISNEKLSEYGVEIANNDGCPYALGILIHSILFLLLFSVTISKNHVYIITVTLMLILFGLVCWI